MTLTTTVHDSILGVNVTTCEFPFVRNVSLQTDRAFEAKARACLTL